MSEHKNIIIPQTFKTIETFPGTYKVVGTWKNPDTLTKGIFYTNTFSLEGGIGVDCEAGDSDCFPEPGEDLSFHWVSTTDLQDGSGCYEDGTPCKCDVTGEDAWDYQAQCVKTSKWQACAAGNGEAVATRKIIKFDYDTDANAFDTEPQVSCEDGGSGFMNSIGMIMALGDGLPFIQGYWYIGWMFSGQALAKDTHGDAACGASDNGVCSGAEATTTKKWTINSDGTYRRDDFYCGASIGGATSDFCTGYEPTTTGADSWGGPYGTYNIPEASDKPTFTMPQPCNGCASTVYMTDSISSLGNNTYGSEVVQWSGTITKWNGRMGDWYSVPLNGNNSDGDYCVTVGTEADPDGMNFKIPQGKGTGTGTFYEGTFIPGTGMKVMCSYNNWTTRGCNVSDTADGGLMRIFYLQEDGRYETVSDSPMHGVYELDAMNETVKLISLATDAQCCTGTDPATAYLNCETEIDISELIDINDPGADAVCDQSAGVYYYQGYVVLTSDTTGMTSGLIQGEILDEHIYNYYYNGNSGINTFAKGQFISMPLMFNTTVITEGTYGSQSSPTLFYFNNQLKYLSINIPSSDGDAGPDWGLGSYRWWTGNIGFDSSYSDTCYSDEYTTCECGNDEDAYGWPSYHRVWGTGYDWRFATSDPTIDCTNEFRCHPTYMRVSLGGGGVFVGDVDSTQSYLVCDGDTITTACINTSAAAYRYFQYFYPGSACVTEAECSGDTCGQSWDNLCDYASCDSDGGSCMGCDVYSTLSFGTSLCSGAECWGCTSPSACTPVTCPDYDCDCSTGELPCGGCYCDTCIADDQSCVYFAGGEVPACTGLSGDCTQDGSVNVGDVVMAVQIIINGPEAFGDLDLSCCDADQDGYINITDVILIVNIVLGTRTTSRADKTLLKEVLSLLHSEDLQGAADKLKQAGVPIKLPPKKSSSSKLFRKPGWEKRRKAIFTHTGMTRISKPKSRME